MNNLRYRKNSFSRNLANEAKMGAYYTDISHAMSIGEMLSFPDEEVCCLEPCIGNGEAVLAAVKHGNVKVFGVELNDAAADKVRIKEGIETCLKADFLSDVIIKHNAFSLCFCNPPYLDDEIGEAKRRCEKLFLEKITANYLRKEGVLIFIVSEKNIDTLGRYLLRHYEVKALYRFRETEFMKWHQIVFVGIKKEATICSSDEIEEFLRRCEVLDELPEHPSEKIPVLPSNAVDIDVFTTKDFDVTSAYRLLDNISEFGAQTYDYDMLLSRILTQKSYGVSNINTPAIPLKKDSLYLLAAAGIGQGIVGTEGEDMHMQRGVVRVVEDVSFMENEGNINAISVTQRSQVAMHIIETSGKITELS